MKLSTLLILYGAAVVTTATGKQRHLRIAGGQDAAHGQFPWLVSIRLTNSEDTWHLCDGVLISTEWVLTAAHCLDSEQPEWLAVVTGEHRTDVEDGTEQLVLVDRFIQHPDYIYYEKPYINDLGLVHLASPVTLDTYTQVALLHTNYLDIPEWCLEAGWGQMVDGGGESDMLQFAAVPMLSSNYCEVAYTSPHDPKALCGGYVDGGVGFCAGDNGGGLVCWIFGEYEVSGILSWRDGCALPNKPGVYMDVFEYRDWIESIVPSIRFRN